MYRRVYSSVSLTRPSPSVLQLDADDKKPKSGGVIEYDSDEDDDIFKEIHMPI